MGFLGTDVPDARILRRHHRQAIFDSGRIVTIGDIRRIQRMRYRDADHSVRQPFDIVHIAGNRRIAEVEIQHMRQLVKVTFIYPFFT